MEATKKETGIEELHLEDDLDLSALLVETNPTAEDPGMIGTYNPPAEPLDLGDLEDAPVIGLDPKVEDKPVKAAKPKVEKQSNQPEYLTPEGHLRITRKGPGLYETFDGKWTLKQEETGWVGTSEGTTTPAAKSLLDLRKIIQAYYEM